MSIRNYLYKQGAETAAKVASTRTVGRSVGSRMGRSAAVR